MRDIPDSAGLQIHFRLDRRSYLFVQHFEEFVTTTRAVFVRGTCVSTPYEWVRLDDSPPFRENTSRLFPRPKRSTPTGNKSAPRVPRFTITITCGFLDADAVSPYEMLVHASAHRDSRSVFVTGAQTRVRGKKRAVNVASRVGGVSRNARFCFPERSRAPFCRCAFSNSTPLRWSYALTGSNTSDFYLGITHALTALTSSSSTFLVQPRDACFFWVFSFGWTKRAYDGFRALLCAREFEWRALL